MKRRSFKIYFLLAVGFLATLFAFLALAFNLYKFGSISFCGFSLLFEYPEGEFFFVILSWVELIATLVLIGFTIRHFLKSDDERLKKFEKKAVIVSLVISIIYMIEGFVFKSDMDGGYSLGSTSGYVPFIFVVLFFIAYFASDKFMPEDFDPLKKENVSQNSEGNSNKKVYSERERLETLKQYKELLDMGAITQEEFDKKKASILSEDIK